MNSPVRTVYMTDSGPATTFKDLATVRLRAAVLDRDGREVPVASAGTVVAVWGDGVAYEVEFEEPFHTLACVEVEFLEADLSAA